MNKITASGYKSDLCAGFQKPEFFEIKGVLSDNATVSFPSIYGERACRQLKQILVGLSEGEHFTYILAILSPQIRRLIASEVNSEYSRLLRLCLEAGMRLRAYRLQWHIGGNPAFMRTRGLERGFMTALTEVTV
jgi:DNA-binding sugar fermentation-stimulating protein